MDSIKNIKLTFQQMFQIVGVSVSAYTKGSIIAEAMKEICFINNNKLYVLNPSNMSYEEGNNINDQILYFALTILDTSFKSLSDGDRVNLFTSNKKIEKYHSISNNTIALIKVTITRNNIEFNNTPKQIHFKNGYMDMVDGIFKQRTNQHYITKFIDRDYKKATTKDLNEINKLISQIYPNKEDRDTMIKYLSICLSWESTKLQTSLFLLGKGASGKSTILQLMENCLGPYVKSLNSSTFSNANNINKAMNTYSGSPNILLTYINEVSDRKMDTSIFKEFIEGKCNTIKLYKEGSHEFNHNSMVILMGNLIPIFLTDSGMTRRIQGYMHSSQFVDGLYNEKEHIYKKDMNLINNSSHLMDALFEILFLNCREWMKNHKLIFPKSFNETSQLISNVNDTIQDFVDKFLIKTKDDNDRIGKDDMLSLYKSMYPHSHITRSQLLMGLKEKNIEYSKSHRCEKLRGCYMFVRERSEDDPEEEDDKEEIKHIKNIKIKKPKEEDKEEIKFIKSIKIPRPIDTTNIINEFNNFFN